MRHVHSCGRRLFVVWVAAALFFALSAGQALASSTPSAPPTGTITTIDPRDDFAGDVLGSGASSTECFDALSTSACSDHELEVANAGAVEVAVRFPNVDPMLDADLDLIVLICTDDPLNPMIPDPFTGLRGGTLLEEECAPVPGA